MANHPETNIPFRSWVQYACHEFRSVLGKNPLIIRSMSRKGNCWDNAVAESFFKTLKAKYVYQHKIRSQGASCAYCL